MPFSRVIAAHVGLETGVPSLLDTHIMVRLRAELMQLLGAFDHLRLAHEKIAPLRSSACRFDAELHKQHAIRLTAMARSVIEAASSLGVELEAQLSARRNDLAYRVVRRFLEAVQTAPDLASLQTAAVFHGNHLQEVTAAVEELCRAET